MPCPAARSPPGGRPLLYTNTPSGSDADVPARAEGPRDQSGTGVASTTEPSKLASSSSEHTLAEDSTRSFISDGSPTGRRASRSLPSGPGMSVAARKRGSLQEWLQFFPAAVTAQAADATERGHLR